MSALAPEGTKTLKLVGRPPKELERNVYLVTVPPKLYGEQHQSAIQRAGQGRRRAQETHALLALLVSRAGILSREQRDAVGQQREDGGAQKRTRSWWLLTALVVDG